MIYRQQLTHRLLALLVGPAFLFVLGCSDDGLGKRLACQALAQRPPLQSAS